MGKKWWVKGVAMAAFAISGAALVGQSPDASVDAAAAAIKFKFLECKDQRCWLLPPAATAACNACDFSGSVKVVLWCFDEPTQICTVPNPNLRAACDGWCVLNPQMPCDKSELECQ